MRGYPGDKQQSYICGGYRVVLCPDHPRVLDKRTGYVFEHVLIAEKALGRPLEKKHPVHHHNEIRSDNRNQNLVICEDKRYHHLLHRRRRVLLRGGDPNTDKICQTCQKIENVSQFSRSRRTGDGLSGQCRACQSIRSSAYQPIYNALRRARRAAKRTQELMA